MQTYILKWNSLRRSTSTTRQRGPTEHFHPGWYQDQPRNNRAHGDDTGLEVKNFESPQTIHDLQHLAQPGPPGSSAGSGAAGTAQPYNTIRVGNITRPGFSHPGKTRAGQ